MADVIRIAQRHFRRLPSEGGLEAAFAIEAFGRWVRIGLFVGEAPGSHMIGKNWTAWRTRGYGLCGVNVRFGWWPAPCVTMLLHMRPVRS